jgi:predicted chitinase
MGKNIVDDPDKLVTDPKTSAESALAYWKLNPQLGKLADAGNFQQVRKLINGGTIGAEQTNASTIT